VLGGIIHDYYRRLLSQITIADYYRVPCSSSRYLN
jgi:hypothetical protein